MAVDQSLNAAQALEERLAAIGDPTERLVAALKALCRVGYEGHLSLADSFGLKVLSTACPEIWKGERPITGPRFGNMGVTDSPAWDGQAIARWFAARAAAAGVAPNATARWRTFGKGAFGKSKLIEPPPEPAWGLKQGSTHRGRTDEYETAYVFPDGRLMLQHVANFDAGVAYNLRGVALVQMAELLGLGG